LEVEVDITINHVHSIELHGAAVWALVIILAIIAAYMVAPMAMSFFPTPLPAPQEPMGFHK
jgi:hypothetical protein